MRPRRPSRPRQPVDPIRRTRWPGGCAPRCAVRVIRFASLIRRVECERSARGVNAFPAYGVEGGRLFVRRCPLRNRCGRRPFRALPLPALPEALGLRVCCGRRRSRRAARTNSAAAFRAVPTSSSRTQTSTTRPVAAGAEVLMELEDADYGGRGYSCRDPEGQVWSFGSYDPRTGD